MHRIVILFAILLFFCIPISAVAQESVGGVISGQVINDTVGGGSLSGIEVTLLVYVDDVMTETKTAITDGEGMFKFENVATEHEYLVSTNFMGVDYYYIATFSSEETQKFVEIFVCDATTSDEEIKAGLAHKIIKVEEESLHITEVLWLVNDGDKTYTGTDGVLVFTLPKGAFDFKAPQELIPDYQFLDENMITYLVPFPPGERQLTYSYKLVKPITNEFSLSLVSDYPTDSLELMVQGEDVEISVSRLAPAEPVVTSTGERYIRFRGENLPSGALVILNFSHSDMGGGMPFVILWVIIGIVIAGIIVYMVKKKRQGTNGQEIASL